MSAVRWLFVVVLLCVTRSSWAWDMLDDTPPTVDFPVKAEGQLIIAGGGELPGELFEYFVSQAGGSNARIVLIPTAYPFSSYDEIDEFYGDLRDFGIESLEYLDTDDRESADDDDFTAALREATGVWIGGGDQGRLADRYVGTKVEELIRQVFLRGGVVGGTSAGASILSEVMIRDGTSEKAMTDRGLSLAREFVIDQHFSERQRAPRLQNVLSQHHDRFGLGIDEGTAAIFQGSRMRVVGKGKVWLGFYRDDTTVTLAELTDGDELDLGEDEEDDVDLIESLKLNSDQHHDHSAG